eukprot:4549-Rhodomonas_salina.1
MMCWPCPAAPSSTRALTKTAPVAWQDRGDRDPGQSRAQAAGLLREAGAWRSEREDRNGPDLLAPTTDAPVDGPPCVCLDEHPVTSCVCAWSNTVCAWSNTVCAWSNTVCAWSDSVCGQASGGGLVAVHYQCSLPVSPSRGPSSSSSSSSSSPSLSDRPPSSALAPPAPIPGVERARCCAAQRQAPRSGGAPAEDDGAPQNRWT